MSTPTASTSTLADRPEAEPLPKKVGELGYIPPKSPKTPDTNTQSQTEENPLPARHPADRPEQSPTTESNATPTEPASTNAETTTNNNSIMKKSWRQRLSLGGVSMFSIFRIIVLLIFIGATGAAWGITIKVFNVSSTSPASSGSSQNPDPSVNVDPNAASDNSDNGNGPNLPPSFSSLVIVHVSFTIVALVELLFLERSIFHARAERYLHKHGMARGGTSAAMGIAPWNRLPLPTYAAALAENGRGTGDVEDGLIAIPPPPAYGNTRGSVLLLSGFLRDSLVRNINRSSQQSSSTRGSSSPTPREMEEGRSSRPISYDASEEVDNAKRAMELEAALTSLEGGGNNGTSHSA